MVADGEITVRRVLFIRCLADCVLAGKLYLSLGIDANDLHGEAVAFPGNVGNLPDAGRFKLGDMDETLGPRENLDERAEIGDLFHDSHIDLSQFGFTGE